MYTRRAGGFIKIFLDFYVFFPEIFLILALKLLSEPGLSTALNDRRFGG